MHPAQALTQYPQPAELAWYSRYLMIMRLQQQQHNSFTFNFNVSVAAPALPKTVPVQQIEQQGPGPEYLDSMSLGQGVAKFLQQMESGNKSTYQTYKKKMKMLFDGGFLVAEMTLREFSKLPTGLIVQAIRQNNASLLDESYPERTKKNSTLKEATLQSLAGLFQSLLRFLEEYSHGVIKYKQPAKAGTSKVFKALYEKTQATLLTAEQLRKFLPALKKRSLEAWFCAIFQLQGCRRISETICVRASDCDFRESTIKFTPLKKRGKVCQPIVISFPEEVMAALKEYLGDRASTQEYIFPAIFSQKTEHIAYKTIWGHYREVFKELNIAVKESSHCLRATGVSGLYKMGLTTDKVMEVSGHADPRACLYYNLNDSDAKNTTRQFSVLRNLC